MTSKLQRIRYLRGRLAHYRFGEIRHIFSESFCQIRFNTPYLDQIQYEKYRRLGQEVIGKKDCVVIDVGGFNGSFARSLSRFVSRRIVCFEPSVSRKGDLEPLISELPEFEYHSIALGDKPGHVLFFEHSDGSLSSLHEMRENAYSNTEVIASYEVRISTLDIEYERLGISEPVFLKIDTQGHDFEVLTGSEHLLSSGRVFALMVEMVTVQKYKDQPLLFDLLAYLMDRNMILYDLWPIYREADGRVTEFDAIFIQKREK